MNDLSDKETRAEAAVESVRRLAEGHLAVGHNSGGDGKSQMANGIAWVDEPAVPVTVGVQAVAVNGKKSGKRVSRGAREAELEMDPI
jgi:hypothetical protein